MRHTASAAHRLEVIESAKKEHSEESMTEFEAWSIDASFSLDHTDVLQR